MLMAVPRSSDNHHITLNMSNYFLKKVHQGTATTKLFFSHDHDIRFFGKLPNSDCGQDVGTGSAGSLPI
jgi:hypothetical protein